GPPNLSIILGGMGTNLESLVTLYTALARNGQAGRPRLNKNDPVRERYLMSPGAAYITRQMLSRPLPGQEGIARLSGELPVAWKTGTSYGFRDAWALGLMGDYVVGIWVGRPDGSPSPGQYGAVTAVPLMAQVIESLPLSGGEGTKRGMDQPPDTVEQQTICWPSGIFDTQIPGSCMVRHKAWILNHQIPPTLTENLTPGEASPGVNSLLQTIWVDAQGNRAGPFCGGIKKVTLALWPWAAEPWIPGKWRRNRLIPKISPQCPDLSPITDNRLRITSISNDSLLTSPPGQAQSPLIPLETLGGQGRLYWFLNRRPLDENKDENKDIHQSDANRVTPHFMPMPAPGTYQLAVMDTAGNSDMVNFRVIASRAD
ncbi:MAG: penicillin-binding protein 1C, partial [Proteobacteria bacterium]|nr:penicillin-binding protein 1C [Pseudomonadota bacterium]